MLHPSRIVYLSFLLLLITIVQAPLEKSAAKSTQTSDVSVIESSSVQNSGPAANTRSKVKVIVKKVQFDISGEGTSQGASGSTSGSTSGGTSGGNSQGTSEEASPIAEATKSPGTGVITRSKAIASKSAGISQHQRTQMTATTSSPASNKRSGTSIWSKLKAKRRKTQRSNSQSSLGASSSSLDTIQGKSTASQLSSKSTESIQSKTSTKSTSSVASFFRRVFKRSKVAAETEASQQQPITPKQSPKSSKSFVRRVLKAFRRQKAPQPAPPPPPPRPSLEHQTYGPQNRRFSISDFDFPQERAQKRDTMRPQERDGEHPYGTRSKAHTQTHAQIHSTGGHK